MTAGLSSLAARVLLATLLVAPLCVSTPARAEDAPALKAGTFSPARVAPDFTLRGTDGKDLKISSYRGKVVILAFGFTSCPAICPTTLAVLAQTRKSLGADADKVQVVYVTVDPERDDVAHLREFLAKFDPAFVGGTGTEEELAAVRSGYGVTSTRMPFGDDYGFNHSSYTYLIDRDGNLAALMPYGHSAEDYVHDVKILLAR